MKNEEIFLSQAKSGKIDRGTFIKGAIAAGLVVAVPATQAIASSSSAKAKVVIVGGGAAGISIAARLMDRLKSPDVTIIDPSDKQFYQPGFTMIGGGIYSPDEVYLPQKECMPDGVKWVKENAVAIDPEAQNVKTDGGKVVEYDFLVVSPGLQMNFDQVEGISRDNLGAGNAHCIYDYQGSIKTWNAVQEVAKNGGKAIFTNTYTKHKCGGAPKKIMFLTEHLSRKNDCREKLEFHYFNAAKDLYDVDYYKTRLQEIIDERKITVHPAHKLRGIDIQSKKAYFDVDGMVKTEVKDAESGAVKLIEELKSTPLVVDYDFMHFTPPMSVPDFVRDAGLGADVTGDWVDVDINTLVHKKYKNIISFGDCANLPTSKTSAAVRMQVPIATDNLISLMEGKEPVAKYDGYTACPIITQYGKVLLCEFDYNKTPKPTLPFIDGSHEHVPGWILKKYILKPLYFYGMLNGLC